jgi:hypothetical protein
MVLMFDHEHEENLTKLIDSRNVLSKINISDTFGIAEVS